MANFDSAVSLVLQHEGGYTSDPTDPGGETKYGISHKAYPDLNIHDLTVDQAKEIYRTDYWLAGGYHLLTSDAVSAKAFDFAVNCGVKTANRILQNAICACGRVVDVDGKLGPNTICAANALPDAELLPAVKQEAIDHYERIVAANPKLEKFLKGWKIRANS